MSSDKKRNIMPDAIGYIDDDIVSGVLDKIDKKNNPSRRPRKRNALSLATAAFALAACAILIALAIPSVTTIITDADLFRPVGADDATGLVQQTPDGSRGLLYEINEDGESASFIGYGSCTDETVYIASTYQGMPVTAMYNRAFEGVLSMPYYDNPLLNIKHLVISDTVKTVDVDCIRWCTNIKSVYYGASVENIRPFYFYSYYGWLFSKVEVSPDNPYYSDEGNCIVDLRTKALVLATPTTVIPDDGSVEIIAGFAFATARHRLSSIVIPEGVKVIDFDAFHGCEHLEEVVLPDSLEVIEGYAFASCFKLKKLELGTNLKVLRQDMFHDAYTPEVYYRGTVEQWEAVIKDKSTFRSPAFTVNCTDGTSLSYAGERGYYEWRELPEYEAYHNWWLTAFFDEAVIIEDSDFSITYWQEVTRVPSD